jgi:hypothetical protein
LPARKTAASPSPSPFSFARHVWQLEGASPLSNRMEVKD